MKAHYDLKNPRKNPFAERMKNGYRITIDHEPIDEAELDETDIAIINEMRSNSDSKKSISASGAVRK